MTARLALVAALCVALALPAVAPASTGPDRPAAQAAGKHQQAKKKRCKKGQVRKGRRCVRRTAKPPVTPPVDPVVPDVPVDPVEPTVPQTPAVPATGSPEAQAAFTGLLAGSVLTRVYASTGATTSAQGNDRYWFCADGTLRFYSEYVGYTGNAYVTEWSGTWRVERAGFTPDGQAAEAVVAYTANTTEIPPQGQVIVQLGGSQAAVGDASGAHTYEWARGAAGC